MTGPVTLLILVTAGERSELTGAMLGATQDVLGAQARVAIREVPGEPSDATALETEARENATAVVEITWVDARHQRASLKVHVATNGRWVERMIGFAPSDADTERGRTLGFAIASILPQEEANRDARDAGASTSGATVPNATSPPAPAPQNGPTGAAPLPNPVVETPRPRETPVTRPRAETAPPAGAEPRTASWSRWAIDVSANGAFNGDASGVGGTAALRWLASERVALRLGLGLRESTLNAPSSTLLTPQVAAGIAVELVLPTPREPFGAAVRLDYLEVNPVGARSSSPADAGANAHNFGLFSGADLMAEGVWRFVPDVLLLVGAGVEDVNGLTPPLKVSNASNDEQATIPPLRFVADLGVRVEL